MRNIHVLAVAFYKQQGGIVLSDAACGSQQQANQGKKAIAAFDKIGPYVYPFVVLSGGYHVKCGSLFKIRGECSFAVSIN